jgi:hypothetical protein
MTTNAPIRRVSSPAYYLARPAALWLAAFTPQSQSRPPSASASASEPRPADRASCVGEASGRAAGAVRTARPARSRRPQPARIQ